MSYGYLIDSMSEKSFAITPEDFIKALKERWPNTKFQKTAYEKVAVICLLVIEGVSLQLFVASDQETIQLVGDQMN